MIEAGGSVDEHPPPHANISTETVNNSRIVWITGVPAQPLRVSMAIPPPAAGETGQILIPCEVMPW